MSQSRAQGWIGEPITRVEGFLKVTGGAKYSADMPVPGRVAYAVLVGSTVTRGRILKFDFYESKKVAGLIDIFTYQSGLRLLAPKDSSKTGGRAGNGNWMPLQDPWIHWNGEPVAIVLAETLEAATHAASVLNVSYSKSSQNVDMNRPGEDSSEPEEFFHQKLRFKKGDADSALWEGREGAVRSTYETPVEHHNPMELHATLAFWEGDRLTAYDATQNVMGTQSLLASSLGIPRESVKVVSLFLGGGFGCKGFYWPHTSLAAAASRRVHRPVKLVLTREQMFTLVGNRSRTEQQVALSARKEGQLTAVKHHSTTQTSRIAKFIEPCGFVSKMLYQTPNLQTSHRLVELDVGTPCPMRAPGEATGSFALECAMDELSYRLGLDPIEFRLKNLAQKNPEDGLVFSSKHLKECYLAGSKAFGWSKRSPKARSGLVNGRWIGWGMATAAYPANRVGATAAATVSADGYARVICATQDLGTGTYTIMTQIAAEELGLPLERVRFELGNSTYPSGPGSGGSQTAASVGPAVLAAAREAKLKIARLAISDPSSPLEGALEDQIGVQSGRLYRRDDPSRGESYGDILKRHSLELARAEIHVEANTRKIGGNSPSNPSVSQQAGESAENPGAPDPSRYSFHSFGAHFVELSVDADLGEVRLSRMLGVYDVGRVLNAKTARSQAIGGMTWGAGMALMEESIYDAASGRIVTANLADYRVPVNADIPPTEVLFIDIPDPHIGPIGMRGLGEIPITGMAAAIANAVYHATGKRVRQLPITPDKLIVET